MNMYFTYGSAEQFPYGRSDYVMVKGANSDDCIKAYRKIHPDVNEGLINCSDYYTEDRWENDVYKEFYFPKAPIETIESEKYAQYAAIKTGSDLLNALVMDLNECNDILLGMLNEADFSTEYIKETASKTLMDLILYHTYSDAMKQQLEEMEVISESESMPFC